MGQTYFRLFLHLSWWVVKLYLALCKHLPTWSFLVSEIRRTLWSCDGSGGCVVVLHWKQSINWIFLSWNLTLLNIHFHLQLKVVRNMAIIIGAPGGAKLKNIYQTCKTVKLIFKHGNTWEAMLIIFFSTQCLQECWITANMTTGDISTWYFDVNRVVDSVRLNVKWENSWVQLQF